MGSKAQDYHRLIGPRDEGLFAPFQTVWLTCLRGLLQSSPARAANVIVWVGGVGVGGGTGLDELHVIGWEHSKVAVWAVAAPPALVDHLDPGDDVVGVERDLCVIGCGTGAGVS